VKISKIKGAALISSLMFVSLAATLAASGSYFATNYYNHTYLLSGDVQANMYLSAVEEWASSVLMRDTNKTDSFHDDWAYPLPVTKIKKGYIKAEIADLGSRLNINNILYGDNEHKKMLERLLLLENVTATVDDIILAYKNNGVFFRSKHDLVTSNIMTPLEAERLSRHISFFPGEIPVNLNTADDGVLMALSDQMNDSVVDRIKSDRKKQAIISSDSYPELKGVELVFGSELFLLKTNISIGDVLYKHESTLLRRGQVSVVIRDGGLRG